MDPLTVSAAKAISVICIHLEKWACFGVFFWEISSVEALETGNLGRRGRFGDITTEHC